MEWARRLLPPPGRLPDAHFLPEIGVTLSVEERSGLELAVNKLKDESGLKKVFIWGKIAAKEADYFVAYSLSKPGYAQMPVKSYFYCTTRHYELLPFPELDSWQRAKALAAAAGVEPLKGTPNVILEEREVTEEEQEAVNREAARGKGEDEEVEPVEIVPVKFREVHRLVVLVEAMASELSVVPKGAYVVDATHDVVANEGYKGLSNLEAGDLHNYFHFSDSKDPLKQTTLSKAGVVAPDAFLDPLADDLPRGVWTIAFNARRSVVMLRNLKWPGFHFFHEIGTGHFGGVYFGIAREERDLVFMV